MFQNTPPLPPIHKSLTLVPTFCFFYNLSSKLPPGNDHWRANVEKWITRAAAVGKNYYEVTKNDENYLTDLGLRRSPNPGSHFLATLENLWPNIFKENTSLKKADIFLAKRIRSKQKNVQMWAPEEMLATCSTREINHILSYIVNSFGMWDDAYHIAQLLAKRNFSSNDPDAGFLLSNLGNIYSAHEDEAALDFYSHAADFGKTNTDVFFVKLRMCTTCIKRINNKKLASRYLGECSEIVSNEEQAHNKNFLYALHLNLSALYQLRFGSHQNAYQLIKKSKHGITTCNEDGLSIQKGVFRRYKFQIILNLATLEMSRTNYHEATNLFEWLVRFSMEEHPESYSEAISFLGTAFLYTGRIHEAISSLTKAEEISFLEGAYARVFRIRQFIASAHHLLNNSTMANFWLKKSMEIESLMHRHENNKEQI